MADQQSTRMKIANALQGFGAGFEGRGPEFLAGQEKQRRLLDEERSQAVLEDAFTIQRMLAPGPNQDVPGAQNVLLARYDWGRKNDPNADFSHSLKMLNQLDRGDIEGALADATTVVDFGIANKQILPEGGAQQQFRSAVSGVQVDPKTGQQFTVITDPNTNESVRVDVPGAFAETPTARTTREVGQVARESKARATATRVSAIKADFGERNRNASRAQVPLREALRLARTADQGLKGSAKLKLARLFPSIDVSDSAALDSNLQRLALDQLQNFKGPTTDFEFGVTQDVVGKVGDSESANIARLNSLDRAMWFARREAQQFNNWAGQNKDPDAFVFDFDEEVKTKKGTFTLTDLQDTAVENNMTIEQVLRSLNK